MAALRAFWLYLRHGAHGEIKVFVPMGTGEVLRGAGINVLAVTDESVIVPAVEMAAALRVLGYSGGSYASRYRS